MTFENRDSKIPDFRLVMAEHGVEQGVSNMITFIMQHLSKAYTSRDWELLKSTFTILSSISNQFIPTELGCHWIPERGPDSKGRGAGRVDTV